MARIDIRTFTNSYFTKLEVDSYLFGATLLASIKQMMFTVTFSLSILSLCLARSFLIEELSTVSQGVTGRDLKVRSNQQNTSTIAGILDTCYYFLDLHLCEGEKWGKPYHFYRPSIDKYSADQWLWDSGAHMIVWSHRNVTNSILDLRTMLLFQQPDGRIPEQIYWQDRTEHEEKAILRQYSNTQFNDITQMPVLPYSLRAIYNKTHDKEVLQEFLHPLVNYFQWWRDVRDTGDGLVYVIHNWESGLDASPAYDPAFHLYITELNETAYLKEYSKFKELIQTYRVIYDWNMTAILGRDKAPNDPTSRWDTWFKVKDLAVNCVYASGWKILSDLAAELGDDVTAKRCLKEFYLTSEAIVQKMFITEQGHYNSLYVDSDGLEKTSIANTVQNLFPLLLGDALPSEHRDIILAHIQDEKKFNATFMLPTVAMDDAQFSATFPVNLMWRGPVWGFTNWFVLEGLALHQRLDLQV